ncbi:translocation/assembly module TamB, partial [bacterium]|nr:translocation/assembly module TamB [bacterium]
PGKVEAQGVELAGEGYDLVGEASLSYKDILKDTSFALKGTLKNAANAAETYSVNASYASGLLDARVGVAGLPIERYIKRDVRGVLEGTLSSQGKLDLTYAGSDAVDFVKRLPPVTFDAKVVGGEFRAVPVKMSISGALEEGVLKLKSPKIEYLGHQLENVSATVLHDQLRIDLAFDYKTVVGSERFEAGVIAQATLKQPQPAPGPAAPDLGGVPGLAPPLDSAGKPLDSRLSVDFSGKLTNVKYRETLATSWEFSGTYDKGNLTIEGDKGSLRGSLGADGAFELTLRDRFPISANVKGTMADNIVTATVDNLALDLKKISPLLSLEKDKIKILDGALSGSLSFKGPVTDPEINGSLSLANASMQSEQLVTGKLGPFSTTIDFAGKNLEMAPTTVLLEQGLVSVSASALLDQWSLTDLKFNVASDKDSVINVSTQIAGITVIDAKAKVDLVLSLENDVLVAEGNIYFERGQVLINPQGFLPVPGAEPPDPNAPAYRIRASMTFGKQLEIYLPDNNIPLVRGFTSPGSALKLQYDSASQEFSLDGRIDLRTGYVLYYLRNFFLKSGSIEFAENTAKFNPLITASAELRESNALGTVKIMLDVEKSSLNDLQPRLSSVPFYTETELVSMMSGGVLAVDTSDNSLNLREAAIASSEFIPQLNIFKRFEQNVQKALGVDIVFIRSSFIQRWLLDLTKPATDANPEDPLARYLDQSELYVGKYITDSAFLHGGLKIKEDPLVSSSRLRLDSEFGIELESPLGLINWSITPSWDEGSFVTGQQLSLSWRYVY